MWIDLSFSCLQISSLQLEKAYTLSSQTFAEYVFAQIRWPCWVDTRHFLCNFPLRWERHLAAVSLIFQGNLHNRYGNPNWEWPMRSMSMFDSCCSFTWNSNLFFFLFAPFSPLSVCTIGLCVSFLSAQSFFLPSAILAIWAIWGPSFWECRLLSAVLCTPVHVSPRLSWKGCARCCC